MSPTSTRMIASLLYASRNSISLMGVLAVVWYAHKTLGSSSGQMPFCPLEPSLNDLEQGSVHNLYLSVGL